MTLDPLDAFLSTVPQPEKLLQMQDKESEAMSEGEKNEAEEGEKADQTTNAHESTRMGFHGRIDIAATGPCQRGWETDRARA